MKITKAIAVLLASAILLGACGTNTLRSGDVSTVSHGTVMAMTPVRLAGDWNTRVGSAIGGILGTVAGASAGHSVKGVIVGALIGNVVGALGGNAFEEKLAETDGLTVAVKTDRGEEIAVAQKAADIEALGVVVGSRVRILRAFGKATIERD